MKIKVLFFANLKDVFGEHEKTVEINSPTTIEELSHQLFQENKEYSSASLMYAVNETYENSSYVLKDGDVLALLPPVSGG